MLILDMHVWNASLETSKLCLCGCVCVCVCLSLFQCEIQALQCQFQSSIFCHIQVLVVNNSSFDSLQWMPFSWSKNTTINICLFYFILVSYYNGI